MKRSGPVRVLELRSVRGSGGGPEKTILHGAAQADLSRVRVLVCYIRDQRDSVFALDTRARELGVDYVEILERHSIDPRVMAQVASLVRDRKIEVIHSHDYKTDFVALWVARTTGAIPLATAHGWTGQSPRERLLYYPVDRWLLSRFPRVIAVSTEIKQRLVASGSAPDRVTVILNGIDPGKFRRQPERAAAARSIVGAQSAEDIVIGAVGRVEQQKRFDLLLDAMKGVVVNHPTAHLSIVGDGSLLPALRKQARDLQIERHVTFVGHRTDVADLHNGFDLFVQSSEYEGTPNAVLEAMAMETPLVATDAGGTAELFRDGHEGRLVACRNAGALEGAIAEFLIAPQEARVRAVAARRRIENELSFEARTRKLEAIYWDLAHA